MERGARAENIGAVVLAAGQSKRMGQPKLVLPWGGRTVIEHIVSTLREGGASEVVVVTGGARAEVESALAGLVTDGFVRLAHNAGYERSEMLTSLQVGLDALGAGIQAALVTLGDQPTISAEVVRQVISDYRASGARLVVPSYQMRRGHPWLVDRGLWDELLAMPPAATMRDFLNAHAADISYSMVDTPGILKDMDTMEDYRRLSEDSRTD